MRQIDLKNQISKVDCFCHRRAVLIEEVLTEISIPIHPRVAFEHLSLYIQKHLGVVTINSKLEH